MTDTYERIDQLVNLEEKSVKEAVEIALREITGDGYQEDAANLERYYYKYSRDKLLNHLGDAIANDKKREAIELLKELRKRYNTFGKRWPKS
tara:strand:- start:422 stop:697 length:276 start_codon:yes stop_codon:yes gene_type:complete